MSYTHRPEKPIDPDTAYYNNLAFRAALKEADYETREFIESLIEALAAYMLKRGAPSLIDTARRQASEAIAQIVFKGQFDNLLLGVSFKRGIGE